MGINESKYAWMDEGFASYGDLALKDIKSGPDGYDLIIEKVGPFPLPLTIKITYQDGTVQFLDRKVSIWEEGNKIYTLPVETKKMVKKIEWIPGILPDADETNNCIELDPLPSR